MFAHRARPCSLACLVLSLAPFAHGEPPASPTSGKPHTDRHGDPLPPGAIARMGSVRFRTGNDRIELLQFSPDGRTLYSLAESGSIRAWLADSGKEQARFRLPDFGSWDLTADGRLLAARADRRTIRIVTTVTGKTLRELTVPNHDLNFVRLSPDGKAVAALATSEMTWRRFLRVWSLSDGREPRDIPLAARAEEKTYAVQALGFAADGKSLIARLSEKEKFTFRRWDAATGRELPTTPHPYPEDQKPTLSPDGKLLALGVQNDRKEVRVRLMDTANGETRRELGSPIIGRVLGMRFSPDCRTLLAVVDVERGGDAIQLWDVAKGKSLPPPALDTIFARDVVFSPDGRTFAVLEEDAVHLCETASGKRLHRMNISYPFDDMRQTGYIPRGLPARSVVAFSPDSKRLAVAPPLAPLIRIWDVATGKEIRPNSEGHEREVEAIAFAPDGKMVASVGSDGTVRLWEASSGRQLHVLTLAVTEPEHVLISDCASPCLAFSPDSRTIVSVSKLNVVQLWAVDTGASRLQFVVPNGGIGDLLFSPDGKRLLTTGHGRILSWNAATGKAIRSRGASMPADAKRDDEEDTRSKLVLSPDGRLLAAIGERTITHNGNREQVHELRLWERATGKLRWRIPDDDDAQRIAARFRRLSQYSHRITRGLLRVAFAPDGKTLVWNDGEALTLVDVMRGVSLRQFGSRFDSLAEIAFSPRDPFLAIAHPDGRVRFVDPARGTLRGVLDVPGGLGCIAFSPDGRTLATGSDTTILLWDVNAIGKAWRPRSEPPTAEEMDKLWERLGSAKGSEAAEAMARLEDVPQQTVALLRQRLRPALPLESDRASRLLDDLASEDFAVRQRAAKELEKLGELAEPFLRKRLAQHPPLEVRRRLEALAEALEGIALRPEQMRADRAVEVLEHLGTAEAVAVLRELSGGAPAARRTRESKAALARLARRTVAP